VADDKPTYLGDFNKAMLDIDTNMKSIENKAESAESASTTANSNANQALENANSANTKAETAQATAEQAQTTATTAKNTADTAQTTATTAKNTADTANETANMNTQNITNMKKWTKPVSIVDSAITNSSLNCSYNLELKMLSLYGRLNFERDNPNNIILGTLPEAVRPSETRTISNGLTPVYPIGDAGNGAGIPADLTINSQGQIVLYNNGVGAPSRLNYGFVQLMLNISDWLD
jgi:hypothetical protein